MTFGHVHRSGASTRGRSSGQPGAVLVEFAFIGLLLITLSAGSFDYGMAWRAGLATNEAARTAARTGSALGRSPMADYYALSGAKAALENSGMLNSVERVVVYKATTADGAPPAVCLTANSTSQLCNILTGPQFRAMTSASFNATTGCMTTALVRNWCPTSRDAIQLTADYYGIWISTKYTHQFKLIRSATTVNRDAVMRIEPGV